MLKNPLSREDKYFTVAEQVAWNVKVDLTVLGGKVIFERK